MGRGFYLSLQGADRVDSFVFTVCNDAGMILRMPVKRFARMYRHHAEKETKEKYRQMWLHMLPQMAEYKTFDEFHAMATGANVDMRPAAEIIAEINALHGGGGDADEHI